MDTNEWAPFYDMPQEYSQRYQQLGHEPFTEQEIIPELDPPSLEPGEWVLRNQNNNADYTSSLGDAVDDSALDSDEWIPSSQGEPNAENMAIDDKNLRREWQRIQQKVDKQTVAMQALEKEFFKLKKEQIEIDQWTKDIYMASRCVKKRSDWFWKNKGQVVSRSKPSAARGEGSGSRR